jgi:hypothetical protein
MEKNVSVGILPPNFDATKKYPTLYTVKVVHKVLTQFYLFPLEFSIAAWLYCGSA